MRSDDAVAQALSDMRRLALEDPRQAREAVERLVEGDATVMDAVLVALDEPGAGRLRQVVANAVRQHAHKERVHHHLVRWYDLEVDEFARRAISAALDGNRPKTGKPGVVSAGPPVTQPALLQTYRYVADRLAHELRNALLSPKVALIDLSTEIETITDPAIREAVESKFAVLEAEFKRLGRVIALEPEDSHFEIRSIELSDWLLRMNAEYSRHYRSIDLSVEIADSHREAPISASDYLLRLIFWNLWLNAHQAVGATCAISVRIAVRETEVRVLVLDNGAGFPAYMTEAAFQEQFSRHGLNRGRGLLEVADAAQRLRGVASLVRHEGYLRVLVTLPRRP
jgi:signal transduction histidine kinase